MMDSYNRIGDHHLMKLVLESIRDSRMVQLKKLWIFCGLTNIEPELLSTVVLKLEDCTIREARQGQLQAIIAGIRDSSNSSLKHLYLGQKVQKIAPDIVAEAAMKLETLKAPLSCLQVEAILARLAATEDSSLKHLYLDLDLGLLQVAPDIVAGAAMKLETLKAHIEGPQAEAIITRLAATEDSRLSTEAPGSSPNWI